jgi:DNA 3'-phosphatase
MEKDSEQTQISTDMNNDVSDVATKTDSEDSTDRTRSRGTSSVNLSKLPVRKFSFGSNGVHRKSFGHSQTSVVHSKSKWSWRNHRGLIFGSSSQDKPCTKIALFDMDGTLIVNKNGRRVIDWEFFHPSVPQKLRDLKEDGFRIMIASNQLGVSLEVVSATDLQKKIEDFTSHIGVEVTALLATKKDKFRKPEPGMWYFILSSLNNIPVDMKTSVKLSDPVFCRRLRRPTSS